MTRSLQGVMYVLCLLGVWDISQGMVDSLSTVWRERIEKAAVEE